VASEAACQAAAVALGKKYFGKKELSDSMSNCFWHARLDQLMFNTGGSLTSSGKAVCTTEAAGGNAGAHKSMLDCMNHVYCQSHENFTANRIQTQHGLSHWHWRCLCINNVAMEDAREIDECKEWMACIDNPQQHNDWLRETLQQLYQMSAANLGGSSQLLQLSSGLHDSNDTVAKDHDNCVADPDSWNEEEIACDCWDDIRFGCDNRTKDERDKCRKALVCASPDICQSWKNAQCSAADLLQAPSIVAALGKRKGERAVLAAMRRQSSENISLVAPASLEETMAGKCATIR